VRQPAPGDPAPQQRHHVLPVGRRDSVAGMRHACLAAGQIQGASRRDAR
jgi:hypothetical protein